ncbi:MepB family protein [Nonlabens antarcticus]|uniref:MepB family protein n=1 Tax=Nonlabens antarcticus TaxID=392714 RepID=UPI001891ED10|nr:MepB family protein [Nonlabens antarcticus]
MNNDKNDLDSNLNQVKKMVFDPCGYDISGFVLERESKEYHASRFLLDGNHIIYRSAKVTPKKIGQFVTFWKRNSHGVIEPLEQTDPFDFYVVTTEAESESRLGQFVFPKSVLIDKGIVSSEKKEGKRGFRLYPVWAVPNNKQAIRTQKWQLDYFYEINDSLSLERVKKLYEPVFEATA